MGHTNSNLTEKKARTVVRVLIDIFKGCITAAGNAISAASVMMFVTATYFVNAYYTTGWSVLTRAKAEFSLRWLSHPINALHIVSRFPRTVGPTLESGSKKSYHHPYEHGSDEDGREAAMSSFRRQRR